jgi:hypothetical protein
LLTGVDFPAANLGHVHLRVKHSQLSRAQMDERHLPSAQQFHVIFARHKLGDGQTAPGASKAEDLRRHYQLTSMNTMRFHSGYLSHDCVIGLDAGHHMFSDDFKLAGWQLTAAILTQKVHRIHIAVVMAICPVICSRFMVTIFQLLSILDETISPLGEEM